MATGPHVVLSGFADECANHKTAVEQLAVFAALGLSYYSLRFIDLGQGVKNVMKLSDEEIARLQGLNHEYGLQIATIGSPIGKVKLINEEDGSHNVYVPFEEYLERDVMRAIDLAHRFQTRLVRGFSFYPPRGKDPEPFMNEAVDKIGRIAERCAREDVVYGLEIEANLIGSTGRALGRIWREVASPAMVTIFDGGNLSSQNLSPSECFDEYLAMRDSIGWLHIKDYKIDPGLVWQGFVDEERLKNFVPCNVGDSGHARIFEDLKGVMVEKSAMMKSLGAPGFLMDLEPHLKGGGQFGGFSGPDGMGVALRALVGMLDSADIGYDLRDFASLRRGAVPSKT
jgi:sugar phosphate isomerase/epimerase